MTKSSEPSPLLVRYGEAGVNYLLNLRKYTDSPLLKAAVDEVIRAATSPEVSE